MVILYGDFGDSNLQKAMKREFQQQRCGDFSSSDQLALWQFVYFTH